MYDPDEECKAMIAALKKCCEEKNITPYALAKKAGISTSTISYLMNGKTNPQLYTVLVLCDVLGIKIGDLFEDRNVAIRGELEDKKIFITCEEEKLLECYWHLSDNKRKLLKVYMNMLLSCGEELFSHFNGPNGL